MEYTPEPGRDAVRPLTNESLGTLDARVTVPTYDRAALTPAIVHFSVGGFHRAHQLVYLDELAQRGVSTDWGVIGVGLHHGEMREVLGAQDNLYTVVERGNDASSARVVGALTDYLFAPDDPAAVLSALADPRTRLVTMTITRDGYPVDPVGGAFRPDAAEVRADLVNPDRPVTPFGFICEALSRRRTAGLPAFTVLSCDNMQDNGRVTRTAVVAFARLRDEGLADWIEANASFPSSMVDRITPRTTPEIRDQITREFGVDDRWPVVTEPFAQWVVEDDFCNGRPPLDAVGVQFVADVAPYELMKTRLLNAGHCALAYLGYLAGHRTTADVLRDPLFRSYLAHLMDDEVTPLLPAVPGVDLAAYTRTLLERFANEQVGDRLERLCARGSTKMPTYVLPSIREALERGSPRALLTLAVAGWCRYLRGVDQGGDDIEITDARRETLQPLAVEGGSDPRPLLGEREVFDRLGRSPEFARSLESALRALDRDGVRPTMDAYIAGRAAD